MRACSLAPTFFITCMPQVQFPAVIRMMNFPQCMPPLHGCCLPERVQTATGVTAAQTVAIVMHKVWQKRMSALRHCPGASSGATPCAFSSSN